MKGLEELKAANNAAYERKVEDRRRLQGYIEEALRHLESRCLDDEEDRRAVAETLSFSLSPKVSLRYR